MPETLAPVQLMLLTPGDVPKADLCRSRDPIDRGGYTVTIVECRSTRWKNRKELSAAFVGKS